MKTLKSLFMLCAGLSFCACSSDNDSVFPEGTGTVEIRIVPPTVATRAVGSFTGNTDVDLTVTGTYTVILDAASGQQTNNTWTPTAENQGIVKFTNVVGPKSVTVAVNGGVKESNTTLAVLNPTPAVAANKVPAYGETSTFTPDVANKKYTAKVVMAIPVARLEVGEISFTNTDSKFTNLTVAGVYLDNLRTVGGSYVSDGTTAHFTANGDPEITDFYFAAGDPIVNYGLDNPNNDNEKVYTDGGLGDAVSADLLTSSLEGVYTYNFYGATPGSVDPNATYSTAFDNNPHFKICFSESQLNNEGGTMPRYAMITKYKNDNQEYIALENGKIYKVTAAELTPQNIVDDEDGAIVEYTVEVTVQEAKWTIEEVTGEWAQ